MKTTSSTEPIAQHSILKSLILHILPGGLVTLFFFLLKPGLDSSGYPPLLAFLIAVLLVDVPFMLGVMLYEGKKINGHFSLDGILAFRNKISAKTFILVFVGAFVVVYLLVMLVTPISAFLFENYFSWLPEWFLLQEQTQYEAYAKNILVTVFIAQLIVTGIVLPWVEELYFRGFLLPRISRFRNLAPLFGGLLFGFYHIWQVYDFPTVFILGAALSYIVWWQKDLRLSIGLHILANIFSRLMFLFAALSM